MYLLFGGNDYYPSGGANDLIDNFITKEDAIEAGIAFLVKEGFLTWAHVFDSGTREIVWKGEGQ